MNKNPKLLLQHYGIEPKRSLGQNFLHDANLVEKIVSVAEIMPDDIVIEVGPGTGVMTEILAQQAKRVIAVELDGRMEPILKARHADYDNIEYVWGDILEVNIAELVGDSPFLVVANVPYYITNAIIRLFLEGAQRPKRMVMTVQHEVAQRIVAKAGEMNLLAVSAQYYADVKVAMKLKAAAFYPRPDVDSAVIRLDLHDQPLVDTPDDKTFFRVVRAGFGQKRKQLKNSFGDGLHLEGQAAVEILTAANLDPRRRAETLTLQEWADLTWAYVRHQTK